MSQPVPPSPNPDNPPSDPNDPSPPQDPERQAAEARLKGLIKETILEVITEHDAAPPKNKGGKIDILDMLFKPSKK